MLGRCTIPLSGLLKSKPLLRLRNRPILSVSTGEIIANLNADVRLAIPVSELYRLFLERHPGERRHLEELSAKRLLESAAGNKDGVKTLAVEQVAEDQSRLFNEIEITILSAAGLTVAADGRPPSAYVHFQFLGHPDKVTNPVPNTTEPEFNERYVFPTVSNDQQLRLLRRSDLILSVIDMKAEEDEDGESDGLIGEIRVSLAPLSEGDKIVDSFVLKDKDGNISGRLKVSLRWKHRFRKERELGPGALSGLEVETLISAFSAGDVKEGIVDYVAFSRFMDPPTAVQKAVAELRRLCDTEGLSPRSLFTSVFESRPTIDEDFYMQCMLRLRVGILPQEFLQLFKFVDMNGEQSITLDQFLAVLNMDEVAGISAALQEKLRLRARDIAARNVSVLESFKAADQWGRDGTVSRLEFKSVLKRIGFQLVDEPDDEVMAFERQRRVGTFQDPRGGELVRIKTERDTDPLNNTAGSGEEELEPAPGEGGRGGGSGLQQVGSELSQQAQKEREIFQRKLQEIQERSRAALEAASQRQQEGAQARPELGGGASGEGSSVERTYAVPSGVSGFPGGAVVGVNLLDRGEGGEGAERRGDREREVEVDHRLSVSVQDSGVRVVDPERANRSATKLQSAFRGYRVRRSGHSVGDSSLSRTGAEMTDDFRDQEAVPDSLGIISAEQAIRTSFTELQGSHPVPNILGGFHTVDTRHTGFVNRKQFAHVVRQFPVLKLDPHQLRALMDYFDVDQRGKTIDYNAFVRLCMYRSPELMPASKHLTRMVLAPESILAFRAYDRSGNGYLRRADVLRALADLGYNQISQASALSMIAYFETKVEGSVQYSNFVEFVLENELSLLYSHLQSKLREIVLGKEGTDEQNLRRWFRKLDKDGKGNFGQQQLVDFLEEFDLSGPPEVINVMYASMDKGMTGVHLADFVEWLKSGSDSSVAVLFQPLTIAELQRKARIYIEAIAFNGSMTFEDISQSYLVYDWRHPPTGFVSRAEFAVATRRVGFAFTASELRMLASEFAVDDGSGRVAWRKYLAWATPDTNTDAKQVITDLASSGAPKRTAGTITRHLEQCLQRGIDLLAVFGKYDSGAVGRITASEFCSGLGDLGLSSITQMEALEFGDRFAAVGGDFILYRRVVFELLKRVDDSSGAGNIDVIDTVRSHMQRKNVDIQRLRDIFEYYDTKRNGRVLEADLGTIFEDAKIMLRPVELQALADRFSSGGSEYFQYSALLSALEVRLHEGPTFHGLVIALPDDLVAKLRSLFEHLILIGKDFRGEFDRRDDSMGGAVLQADFREIMLDRFRSQLSVKELEKLEKTYRDHNDPRRVNYVRMIRELHPHLGGATNAAVESLEVLEELRQMIRRKYDYLVAGELKRPFRHFARRDGREVSLEEFALGLKDLGFRVSGDQERVMFDIINTEFRKSFRYADFRVFVCDPLNHDVTWKLRRLLLRNHVSDQELLSAMQDADSNDSGLLAAKQFSSVLKSSGVDLSDSDIQRLMIRFDPDEVQRFDIDMVRRFLRGQSEQEEGGELDDVEAVDKPGASKSKLAVETRAYAALKIRVEDKLGVGFSPNEVYAIFDPTGQGAIDLAALLRGARSLGVTWSRPDGRAVLGRMIKVCGGAVDRLSFFKALDIDLGEYKRRGKRDGRGMKSSVGGSGFISDDDLGGGDDDEGAFVDRRKREESDGEKKGSAKMEKEARTALNKLREEVRDYLSI